MRLYFKFQKQQVVNQVTIQSPKLNSNTYFPSKAVDSIKFFGSNAVDCKDKASQTILISDLRLGTQYFTNSDSYYCYGFLIKPTRLAYSALHLVKFFNVFNIFNTTKKPAFCQLPPEVGPCKAEIPSFYYDAKAKSCLPFTYGGCEGNSNRFNNETECKKASSACISELVPTMVVPTMVVPTTVGSAVYVPVNGSLQPFAEGVKQLYRSLEVSIAGLTLNINDIEAELHGKINSSHANVTELVTSYQRSVSARIKAALADLDVPGQIAAAAEELENQIAALETKVEANKKEAADNLERVIDGVKYEVLTMAEAQWQDGLLAHGEKLMEKVDEKWAKLAKTIRRVDTDLGAEVEELRKQVEDSSLPENP